jgi:DNA-binding NarL/FixJ family response regulator
MASVVASREIETDVAAIAVAASDQRARVRIAGALAGRPALAVRPGASARELVASGAADGALVFHCETVGSDELALFAELKRGFPELLIVAVCESANGRSARRAVDGGVDGLVFADQLEAALEPTVAAVLAGQTAVPRELRACTRKPALSFREKQILGMVVMGFTNGEISSRLFLAESTVKSHLSSAFTKLGVRSRSEAATMILDPRGSLGTGILAITSPGDSPRPEADELAAT